MLLQLQFAASNIQYYKQRLAAKKTTISCQYNKVDSANRNRSINYCVT